jgi:ATP-dependent Clp protease adaptor protein ClpS
MSTHTEKPATEKHDGLVVMEPGTRTKTARPPLYKVILLNDDYTPMDFVVLVLKEFFHKEHEDAINIMLEVHNQGASTCGTYTRDAAETKLEQVMAAARQNEHPLQCVMEKE